MSKLTRKHNEELGVIANGLYLTLHLMFSDRRDIGSVISLLACQFLLNIEKENREVVRQTLIECINETARAMK